jgi:undecaprenyl-diphosphatase
LILLYYKKTTLKKTVVFVLSAILVVAAADLISSKLIKEMVMRARPSHHLLLTDKLHFYQFENGDFYKGGAYGFVSSHAANFFGLFTFVGMALRQYYRKAFIFLMLAAVLICISRIYLGVHYLSDIVCGGLLGVTIALLVYRFLFIAIIDKDFIKR